MHSGTQINESAGSLDQARQDEGGQHVGREHVRHAVLCLDPVGLPVADPGIVDHGIEATQAIDLLGKFARAPHGGEVAGHDLQGLRQLSARVRTARRAPAVQDHLVALLNKQSPRHQAQAGRRP
jgi:hypothetical protein